MAAMDRHAWDDRYGDDDLLWRAEPNQFLVAEASALTPGRALDLACGEGRNAVWLAGLGWQAVGVDFSAVALGKARRLAAGRGVEVEWVEADLLEWRPPEAAFDLVIAFYLQLPADQRRLVNRRAASAVAPGGTLLVVGHALANLAGGYGGPRDLTVLYGPGDIAGDVGGVSGLRVEKAEEVRRTVTTDAGEVDAIDVLVRAVRA